MFVCDVSGILELFIEVSVQIFNLNRLRISPLSLVWPIEHSLYLATYVEMQLCERAKKFVSKLKSK